MQNDRSEVPIFVRYGPAGAAMVLRTAHEASEFPLSQWPGKKSEKFRAALQAGHDALGGDNPAMAARRAFLAGGREADVLIKDTATS